MRGFKFEKTAGCVFTGHRAVYLGPGKAFVDEEGHQFPRNESYEVCTDTVAKLSNPPYKGFFAILEPGEERAGYACCAPGADGTAAADGRRPRPPDARLAFANGANDVSKGIATLVGSGTTNCAAVLWGTFWTVVGGLAAAFASQGLVATFSGKGILVSPPTGSAFLLSVACGAIAAPFSRRSRAFRCRRRSPSRAPSAAPGSWRRARPGRRAGVAKVALPRPVASFRSPCSSSPLFSPALRRFTSSAFASNGAKPCRASMSRLDGCRRSARGRSPERIGLPPEMLVRVNALDSLHWISSGATSFFRGLNDTPKILALGFAAAAVDVGGVAFAAVAFAMGLGGMLGGAASPRLSPRR